MTKIPKYWNKAKKYLSKKDKIISKLINKYKSPSEKILTTRKERYYIETTGKLKGNCTHRDPIGTASRPAFFLNISSCFALARSC